jgi:hypothetical protein
MGNFVSSNVVHSLRLPTSHADPQVLSFANGQTAISDRETHPLHLSLGQHHEEIVLKEAPLPRHEVILGIPWLRVWNPSIDWINNVVTINKEGRSYSISPRSHSPTAPRLDLISAHQLSRALKRETAEVLCLVIAKPEGINISPPRTRQTFT